MFLCGSWHGSFRTQSCWESSSLRLLFLLPGLLVTARGGESLEPKYCCPKQWAKCSSHKSLLPNCFWDVHSEVCKAAVQCHDERYVSHRHEISSQCWNMALIYAAKRNSLCFYWIRSNRTTLTKLYSHQFLVTVIAKAEGRHYTSRQLEKTVPVIYVAT